MLEASNRDHSMLLEEDLAREKDLAAEYRERLYEAEREVQTTRNLALKRETQIEQLQNTLNELKWESVDTSRQFQILLRDMELGVRALEKSLPDAAQLARHGAAAARQLVSVLEARQQSLEGLAQEKERSVMQLQVCVSGDMMYNRSGGRGGSLLHFVDR